MLKKEVTIEGKNINLLELPEVKELLDLARKEEKDKLYGRIASLEAQIKVLEDEKVSLGGLTKKQEEELKGLREELGAVKAEVKKNEDKEVEDTPKKKKAGAKKEDEGERGFTEEELAEILNRAVKKEVDVVKKEYEKLLKELAEVKGKMSESQVEAYRKEQLERYKGKIIPELVPKGLKSQEEVNKALQEALEISKNYLTLDVGEGDKKKRLTLRELEEEEEMKKKKEAQAVVPPEKPKGVGEGDLTGKDLLGKVGEMTVEEYKKYRDQILAEIRKVPYSPAAEISKK